MVTDAPMATPTDILTLTQWFSPAFPVGAFAYSHGLEWGIEAGDVSDLASLSDWLETVLKHGAGWNDVVLLAAAYRAGSRTDLAMIDATCRALASSRERLQETDLQGAAFCAAVSSVWNAELDGLSYPVAVGRAAGLEMIPLELTAQVYLQAFAGNLASAAVRLVPLGQTEGQALIRTLTPLCCETAAQAVRADPDDLRASAYLCDIAAMKHETQYSRIFRT